MRMIVAARGDQLTSPLDEKFHTDGYRGKFASVAAPRTRRKVRARLGARPNRAAG